MYKAVSKNTRKIVLFDGSIFLSVNTVKPYVAIKMNPEGFLVQGSDELYDEPGVVFAPKVNGAQRVRLPKIMLKYYPELIGAHRTTCQHEGLYYECSMAPEYRNAPFRLPKGCSYSDIAMPNIEPWTYTECDMADVKRGSYKISLIHTANRTCVLLEPHKHTTPLSTDIYGRGFGMFMGGVASYTAKITEGNPFQAIPQKFLDLSGLRSSSVRKCGTSYLITPIKDDCFFDGAKIDAAEHEGKKVSLCSCCSTGESKLFVNAVKKVFAEYNRLKTAYDMLTDSDVLLPDKKDDIFTSDFVEKIKQDILTSQESIRDTESCLKRLLDTTRDLKVQIEEFSAGDYLNDGTFLPYI